MTETKVRVSAVISFTEANTDKFLWEALRKAAWREKLSYSEAGMILSAFLARVNNVSVELE